MKVFFFTTNIAVILILNSIKVIAQPEASLITTDKIFSPSAVEDAKKKLDFVNKNGTLTVMLFLSFYNLPHVEKRIEYPEHLGEADIKRLGDLIKLANDPSALAKNKELFSELASKGNKKVREIFERHKDKEKLMIINLSLGKSYAHQRKRESEETHPYYDFSIVSGAQIDPVLTDYVTKTCESFKTIGKQFDFDQYDKNRSNDTNLSMIVNEFMSVYALPFYLTWNNKIENDESWDDNEIKYAKDYTSYKTSPTPGMAWKCIAADETMFPIQVTLDVASNLSSSDITFKLSNATDFALRSNKLDKNNLLWIASKSKNSETTIMPVLNGKEFDQYGVNVVSYAREVKTVSVVIVDDENDDVQLHPHGTRNLDPNTPVVKLGANGFFDGVMNKTKDNMADDHEAVDPVTHERVIVAGPDGFCQSEARNENIETMDVGLDLNALDKWLNNVYNPYFIEWKVEKTIHKKAINYDLDCDTYFNPDVPTIKNEKTEMLVLGEEDAVVNMARVGTSQYHLLFVVGVPEIKGTTTPLGRKTKKESAIIFTTNIWTYADANTKNISDILYQVCAHELGHVAFDLPHTTSDDDPNLLTPFGEGLKLRKFQWDILHGRNGLSDK